MSLRMVSVDSSGTFVKEIFCFSMDFIEFLGLLGLGLILFLLYLSIRYSVSSPR